MGAQTIYNAKLHKTFRRLSDEWLYFVAGRTKEDLNVMQQLASAKGPVQVLKITTGFWQKTAHDYAHEYAVIFKLAGNCVMCSVEEAQHAGAEVSPLAKAA